MSILKVDTFIVTCEFKGVPTLCKLNSREATEKHPHLIVNQIILDEQKGKSPITTVEKGRLLLL